MKAVSCLRLPAVKLLSIGVCALGVSASHAADTIVFQRVRVFDGERMLPPTSVLVSQGVIRQVGDDIRAPADAELIEGDGKTLLPGLIDSHVHTFFVSQLEQAAIFGVTTVLDMFADHHFAGQMRSQQADGKALQRADLVSAGTLATAASGHGTQFGLPIPTLSMPQQAQDFVDARLEEGSDFIKIVYDDGSVYGMNFPTLDLDTVAALVAAAHARDKMAVAHIATRQAAREVIETGIDGLVHIFVDVVVDDDFLKLAAEKNVFVIPTLAVLESAAGEAGGASLVEDPELAPFLMPGVAGNLQATFPPYAASRVSFAAARQTVGRLYEAGVPILAGSDAPNPGTDHGASIHRELELLVAAGLEPTAALAAATSVPAKRFSLDNRGRIAPGMRADLVLVDGDPSKSIRATRSIAGVWKQGQSIDRQAYLQRVGSEVERIRQARKQPSPPGSEAGLVSDFEGDKVVAEFGAGWSVSTDLFVGGKSSANYELAADGVQDSRGSLRISGRVDDKPQPRWAGVSFSPGPTMLVPANLSSKQAISFWAKGDSKTYSVMLFFQRLGFRPSMKSFVAGKEWQKYRFPLREFDGCDGSDITGLFFGGSEETGEFAFQIDDVRFE